MSAHTPRPAEAPDVTARFARLLATEPPFSTGFGDAVAGAVRAGRRRRARAIAGRGLAMAACALVVGGGVLAVRPAVSVSPAADSGLFGTAPILVPTSNPVPTPSVCAGAPDEPAADCPSDSADGTRPVADISAADLEPLAKAIAAPDGDHVTITSRGSQSGGPIVTARVSGPAGAYDVTVAVTGTLYVTEQLTSDCSPTKRDDKPCHVELARPDRAAVSVAFSDGSGRANLRYEEPAGVGRTLSVWVDNYTERASGAKVVGPTWEAAGVTPKHIHAAVAASGLVP